MLSTYQKLQSDGRIGPTGPDKQLRPFAEYPKLVRRKDGRKIHCENQAEEVAVKMWAGDNPGPTPLESENLSLARQLAEAQERLAKYERPVQEAAQKRPEAKSAQSAVGAAASAAAVVSPPAPKPAQ